VENLFEDVSKGAQIDLPRVRKIVHETVDGVLRNPDAHVCITQLKNRDDYTAEHSINVCVLSLALGRHLGLDRDQLQMLGVSALLHDIGKIKTPLEILTKPGRLTAQEFDVIKDHTVDGHELLKKRYGLPNKIAQTAFSHHERISGGGYPRGIKGAKIPMWGKIVAIVDVYDAITSDRVYHKGVTSFDALTKIYESRLIDFDPELVEQFIQCVGIYPVGTLVQLTDGQVGLVTSVNPRYRLLPKVKLLLNSEKRPLRQKLTLDLAEVYTLDPETTCRIESVLAPSAYGINVREHLDPNQNSAMGTEHDRAQSACLSRG
jgi:putative nucleotidyltransferase with HDIG domain